MERLPLSTLTTIKSEAFLHFCSSSSTKDSEKWLSNYYLKVLKKQKQTSKQTKKHDCLKGTLWSIQQDRMYLNIFLY